MSHSALGIEVPTPAYHPFLRRFEELDRFEREQRPLTNEDIYQINHLVRTVLRSSNAVEISLAKTLLHRVRSMPREEQGPSWSRMISWFRLTLPNESDLRSELKKQREYAISQKLTSIQRLNFMEEIQPSIELLTRVLELDQERHLPHLFRKDLPAEMKAAIGNEIKGLKRLLRDIKAIRKDLKTKLNGRSELRNYSLSVLCSSERPKVLREVHQRILSSDLLQERNLLSLRPALQEYLNHLRVRAEREDRACSSQIRPTSILKMPSYMVLPTSLQFDEPLWEEPEEEYRVFPEESHGPIADCALGIMMDPSIDHLTLDLIDYALRKGMLGELLQGTEELERLKTPEGVAKIPLPAGRIALLRLSDLTPEEVEETIDQFILEPLQDEANLASLQQYLISQNLGGRITLGESKYSFVFHVETGRFSLFEEDPPQAIWRSGNGEDFRSWLIQLIQKKQEKEDKESLCRVEFLIRKGDFSIPVA